MQHSACCFLKIYILLEKQPNLNRKGVLQALILTLFLIGLPLGSWYYLREGYNYRRALLDDLGQMGQVPPVTATDIRDSLIGFEDLRGKALVLAPLSPTDTLALRILHNISDQFAESRAVVFAFLSKDKEETLRVEADFREQIGQYPGMFFFLPGGSPAVESLLQALPFPEKRGSFVVLADTSHAIRRVYDLGSEKDVRRLVEHLTVVIPGKRTAKPIVVREIEK